MDVTAIRLFWPPRLRLYAVAVRVTTCRDEVLRVARQLADVGPDGAFSPDDVVRALASAGSPYAPSTIRTHVVSRMCVNAPANHAVRYPDLVRGPGGRYRLAEQMAQSGQDKPGTEASPVVRGGER